MSLPPQSDPIPFTLAEIHADGRWWLWWLIS